MHYIRLLNCQCLKQCIEDATFVCDSRKSIFHVCFIVRFASEWFLLLECIKIKKRKEKKSPDPVLLTKAPKRETRGILMVFSLWQEIVALCAAEVN